MGWAETREVSANQRLYRAARAVVKEATPITGAGGMRWTELDNQTFDDLEAAVNRVAPLVGDEPIRAIR